MSNHRTGTEAATTSPALDFTSDGQDNENIEDLSPSARRARCSGTLPASSHPSPPSSACSPYHSAPATVPAPLAPPLIKVEKLDIFSCSPQPAFTQGPKFSYHDAFELLTKEHVPVLQLFIHLLIGEPFGGFVGTPTSLAPQLRNAMKANCAQRE